MKSQKKQKTAVQQGNHFFSIDGFSDLNPKLIQVVCNKIIAIYRIYQNQKLSETLIEQLYFRALLGVVKYNSSDQESISQFSFCSTYSTPEEKEDDFLRGFKERKVILKIFSPLRINLENQKKILKEYKTIDLTIQDWLIKFYRDFSGKVMQEKLKEKNHALDQMILRLEKEKKMYQRGKDFHKNQIELFKGGNITKIRESLYSAPEDVEQLKEKIILFDNLIERKGDDALISLEKITKSSDIFKHLGFCLQQVRPVKEFNSRFKHLLGKYDPKYGYSFIYACYDSEDRLFASLQSTDKARYISQIKHELMTVFHKIKEDINPDFFVKQPENQECESVDMYKGQIKSVIKSFGDRLNKLEMSLMVYLAFCFMSLSVIKKDYLQRGVLLLNDGGDFLVGDENKRRQRNNYLLLHNFRYHIVAIMNIPNKCERGFIIEDTDHYILESKNKTGRYEYKMIPYPPAEEKEIDPRNEHLLFYRNFVFYLKEDGTGATSTLYKQQYRKECLLLTEDVERQLSLPVSDN